MPGTLLRPSSATQEPYIEDVEGPSYPRTLPDDGSSGSSGIRIVLGSQRDSLLRGECLLRFSQGSAPNHPDGVRGVSASGADGTGVPCIVFPDVARSGSMHMEFELPPYMSQYMREVSASLHVMWMSPSIDRTETYRLEWRPADSRGVLDRAGITTAPVVWSFITSPFDQDAISAPSRVTGVHMPACSVTRGDGTTVEDARGLSLTMSIDLKVPGVPKAQELGPAVHATGLFPEQML